MFKKRSYCILFLLASFSLVTFGQKQTKVDLAKKISEATPRALAQEPIAKRPSTDARDKGLKGKVKTLTESSLEGKARFIGSTELFDLIGNDLTTVDYDENYPRSVTAWGYIDGKRVSKTGDISYAPGEKPERNPSDPPDVIQVLGNPDAPGDNRYDVRYEYRYDDQGRLLEEKSYGHSNDLFHTIKYSYSGNQRDIRDYDSEGNEISRTVEILDKNGNVIEELGYGRKGISSTRFMTYEFDVQGNWIVQKAFEAKGKTGRKLLWTSFRTFTYYP